jgi:methyl-accepting chemotaxis protein
MSLSIVTSVLVVRQILITRLEERVQQSMQLEIEEFHQLRAGNNPQTGQPFQNDVEAIFDVFLSRNIPEDDEYLITIADGQFYRASSLALPTALQPDGLLIQQWASLSQPRQGMAMTSEGSILYQAEPIQREPALPLGNEPGPEGDVFVVAYLTAGERQEVDEAVQTVMQVSLSVLAIASLLAWLAAGKVLAPLRLLSQTARSISDANLTERIPIRGSGDIAELAVTFNDMMDRLEATFNSQRQLLNDVGPRTAHPHHHHQRPPGTDGRNS